MKKGIMQLSIEIDYDEMIKEENISVLAGYTGKITFDELAKAHMESLGRALNEVVKDMPYVRYNIMGDFETIEEQSEPIQGDSISEDSDVLVEEKPQIESIEAPVDPYEIVEMLNTALEEVSMERGIPQLIKVNSAMQEALQVVTKVELGNEIKRYNGFEVMSEGMEELFLIEYKDYSTNQLSSYSRSL